VKQLKVDEFKIFRAMEELLLPAVNR